MAASYSVRLSRHLDQLRHRPGLNPWLSRLAGMAHFFSMVYRHFEKDRCWQMASALTYTALLAIVPVTAVSFALFNAFGAFQSIRLSMQQFLLRQLIPSSELAQKLDEYLTHFTVNTYQVTFVSILSLFATAVMLFMTIEWSLAHIWSERRTRTFFQNLSTFTSILVWGPLLLGLSTYLTITMSTEAHTYVDPITGSEFWSYLFPYATSVLMFFLGFTILPSARVDYRAALLGSAFSAGMWEVAKYGFSLYVSRAVYYTNVYGSLSTVPVFLLWLYTSWLIFLVGAEICYCFQYRTWLRVRDSSPRRGYALDLLAGLASLTIIARKFRNGEPPPTVVDISTVLRLPKDVVARALQPLRSAGLLVMVRGSHEVYLPARSPSKMRLLEVFRAIHPDEIPGIASRRPELARAGQMVRVAARARAQALENLSVADLLDQPDPLGEAARIHGQLLGSLPETTAG